MKKALVLSLICVLGLAFSGLAATLSGSWDTAVSIDPQQTNFNDAIGIVSVLEVIYTVGDWTFTSVTDLDETGWTDQDFSVAGVLGAFVLTSGLDFDPVTPAFGSWNTTVGVSIAGVSFGADFTLAGGSVALDLSAVGVAGDITVGAVITFGDPDLGCDLDWTGVVINLGFPFCCADIAAEIAFNCDGFDYIEFSTGGIAIPNLPWLTIDAVLVFDLVDGKTLELSPNFVFGDIACFDLDIDVAYTGGDMAVLSLNAFEITGIGLTCDIGAVTFSGYSDFLGLGEYWEVYNISTNDDGCCGPFAFDLTISFLEGGLRLFDIALIEAYMELQVASQFTFDMGLAIDVDSQAFTSWTIGFVVTW